MQELLFLCMPCRLNVLNKCMRFHRNICKGYQVIERTRFCDGRTDTQTDTQTDTPTDRRKEKKQYVSRPLQGGGGDMIYGPLCTSQNNLKTSKYAFIHRRLRLSLASAQSDVSLRCAFAGYQTGFADLKACSDT